MIDPELNLQEPDPKRIGGKFFGLAAALVLILIIGGALILKHKINTPLSASAKTQEFIVQPGAHAKDIADKLRQQGLISNEFVFLAYGYYRNIIGHIQAGSYMLAPNMSIREILLVLNGKAQPAQIVWRSVEGWTVADIANDLDQKKIVAKTDFNAELKLQAQSFDYFGENVPQKNLEGYLFPDTYFLHSKATAKEVIEKMLANTKEKITPEIVAQIRAQNKTVYDVLTLASIVESEVGRNTSKISAQDLATLQDEREIVAGIFINRLNMDMPLQSDATVNYITKKNNPSATSADIQIDSPYNTYKYKGLPPGPISNPSMSAILAVINYRKTDYLYFLSKPDGTAVYAKTLDEQNANKAKYLK